MNEEILSGLKMALERGFNLEESIQSFINAGYNESEVRESASFLSKGFSPLPSVQKEVAVPKEEMKPEAPKDGTVVGKAFDFCDKKECKIPVFVALS